MKRYFTLLLLFAATASAQDLRRASLGDCKLESGTIIRDCRIAYRTYGDRQNKVVVVTTWFGGTTGSLASSIGPGKLFDSSKYYVIAIDALGDGVSSSPSNSAAQPGEQFPRFTIRDMVNTQHELLTRELHIDHVFAIGGLSMGGMQTFQWLASHPQFMDRAIAITGTPKLTSYDLLLWKTELNVLESGAKDPIKIVADINSMHLGTPASILREAKAEAIDGWMSSREASIAKTNHFDYESQLRAMIAHDAGPIAQLNARLLVVVSESDQMVNPNPARDFAIAHGSMLVTLTGDCGHLASACEAEKIRLAVAQFLDAN